MSEFNLSNWLIRDAMGSQRQENRDTYYWWDYDELVASPNEEWQTWTQAEPGLADVLRDAAVHRGKTYNKFRYMYGMSDSEIGKSFKIYIGYHPNYGAYICSIGPYYGTKHADAIDKFYFGVQRKRKSTVEDVKAVVAKNIAKYARQFGIDMSVEDFRFVSRAQSDEFDPSRKRQPTKTIIETVEDLSESSRSFEDFGNRQPIIGEGSNVEPNARGMTKIVNALSEEGGWGDLVQQAMQEQAEARGLSGRQINTLAVNDLSFIRGIYEKVHQKYREKVASGEAAAMGMTEPPKFDKINLAVKSGAQLFVECPTNTLMSRQLNLRSEIAGILSENPTATTEQIIAIMNSHPSRRRKGAKVPEEEVVEALADIETLKEGRQEEGGELFAAIKEDTDEQANQLFNKRGFDDLQTAFDMAKLYFTNLPVDPRSRKKQGVGVTTWAFNPPENFENVTDEDLVRLRGEESRRREEETAKATPEDIERDIGPGEQPDLFEPIEEVEQTVEEIQPLEPVTEEYELSEEDLRDIYGNTLKNLIKIAAELDNDGKHGEAEEVHKVIRKYDKRI